MSSPIPSVPDDADQDVPPPGGSGEVTQAPPDPDAQHRRFMDKSKLKFAFVLVACSGSAVFVLSLVDFTWGDEQRDLTSATALGFIFGRAMSNDK